MVRQLGRRQPGVRDRPDRGVRASPGVVAAVLGTISVWLTYLAGARFFNRNVGLLAAAILAFAFLPVFYSHLALNDVPTLAPVALSLYGTAGVMRYGRMRDYAIAGARDRAGRRHQVHRRDHDAVPARRRSSPTPSGGSMSLKGAARRCALALAIGLFSFLVANPYAILDFSAFQAGVHSQASLAAGEDPVKLGTTPRQRHHLLPVDVHLGPGLGPDARRDRRRDPADRPPADRDGC